MDNVLITASEVSLDDHAQINAGAKILGFNECHIGKHVVIGYDTLIFTSTDTLGMRMDDASDEKDRKIISAPVFIDDYAYIGSQCLIMPGCVIGKGAVVGAQSYLPVATVVKPGEVGYGSPWKVKKERSRPLT